MWEFRECLREGLAGSFSLIKCKARSGMEAAVVQRVGLTGVAAVETATNSVWKLSQ